MRTAKFICLCIVVTALAAGQQAAPKGSAYGAWILDASASKLAVGLELAKGRQTVYENGVILAFVTTKGEPLALAYSLDAGKNCIQLGHTPGAKCELTINDKGGKVSVDSPSGATTAWTWKVSADGQTLTTQSKRVQAGKTTEGTLVGKRLPTPTGAARKSAK